MIRVSVQIAPGEPAHYQFDRDFRIGRAEGCDVIVASDYVSRKHADVVCIDGQWLVRDLGSSNGLFVNGQRTAQVQVSGAAEFRLGIAGPIVKLEIDQPARPAATEDIIAKYFGNAGPAGEHTMLVREAFSHVQARQKRKYRWVLAGLGVVILALGGWAVYATREIQRQKALAEEVFYTIKGLDVDIANLERLMTDERGREEIRKYQARRKDMEKNYDRLLERLRVYDANKSPQDRLVLRIARVFGECELDLPPNFKQEIYAYIGKWKGSGRLKSAVMRAKENGYAQFIVKEMLAQNLAPQFFYLALQESNFDPYVSGPMTRKGIAKGMWQFIPETALKYGLKLGPLVDLRRPDTGDDRHNYQLATKAAARYLKELYSTDAQASGLLVMACYNWGEDYVLPLVRRLPANPRERNFRRLLEQYKDKLPKETYDYVFYIASAAVIGENPRLFGFDFDNPLALE